MHPLYIVGVQSILEAMPKLSLYAEYLTGDAKEKYRDKISLIRSLSLCWHAGIMYRSILPVNASDLVSYLVLQTSLFTAKQFIAHMALESYNVCGWVKEVYTCKRQENS